MSLRLTWYATGAHLVCPWDSLGLRASLGLTWYAPETHLVCSRDSLGMPLRLTWYASGTHLVCSWDSLGMPLRLLEGVVSRRAPQSEPYQVHPATHQNQDSLCKRALVAGSYLREGALRVKHQKRQRLQAKEEGMGFATGAPIGALPGAPRDTSKPRFAM